MAGLKLLSKDRALVLFSGGQDSTTSLGFALNQFNYVETVGFDYGQRNLIELECRKVMLAKLNNEYSGWSEKLGPDHIVPIEGLQHLSSSALVDPSQPIESRGDGLPTTFVPGRNLFFFTFAAAIGYERNLGALVGGMCQTDYSGYPDCRDETLKQLQETLRLGMDADFDLITPLMWKTKADSWQMAHDFGGDAFISMIVEDTHTCYNGIRDELHDWGYGCGACPACELRQKGFEEWHSKKS